MQIKEFFTFYYLRSLYYYIDTAINSIIAIPQTIYFHIVCGYTIQLYEKT